MPPESPRKSSTSSGRGNRFDRPRYLLVEVAGASPLSTRQFETLLRSRLPPGGLDPAFRLIRSSGPLALVAVRHTEAVAFRSAWNDPAPSAARLRTLRTFGTLRKGKVWLARSRDAGPVPRVVPRAGPR